MTNAIWPWVSTAALGRPVVPEVKKNQQGSSCSTAASGYGLARDVARRAHRSPRRTPTLRSKSTNRMSGRGLARGRGVFGKIAMADHRRGTARLAEIGDLVRRLAEIRRHPDRAEPEAREHRLEHLVAILGLHQDAVALLHAPRGQRRRHRVDAPVELGPGPGRIAPDEADLVPVAPRRLAQEMGEVHDPLRDGRNAARGSLRKLRHLRRSRMDT